VLLLALHAADSIIPRLQLQHQQNLQQDGHRHK